MTVIRTTGLGSAWMAAARKQAVACQAAVGAFPGVKSGLVFTGRARPMPVGKRLGKLFAGRTAGSPNVVLDLDRQG